MSLLLGLFAGAALVINEVCYDPVGADAGSEFVEIYNGDDRALDLAGCRLEFANGSGAVRWEVRWTAAAGDVIESGACFLIADVGWTGPPAAAVVSLDLQNGPDAVRLVLPDGNTDTVGWGDLTALELHEGHPADDVSGLALARRPDGLDTHDNAADFLAAEPTPGTLNWPEFAPRLVSWTWQPPVVAAAGRPLRGRLEIRNDGRRDMAGSELRLQVGGVVATATLASVPPGSTAVASLDLTAAESGRLVAAASLSGVPGDVQNWDLGLVQVGPASIRIAEVMAAPSVGGEWCEIVNLDVVPRNLADLSLRDEDGAWRSLPDLVLAPGDCRLLAQDPQALADWLADLATAGVALPCDPAPPVAMGSWPSLNNTAPDSRDFADRLYLADDHGTAMDYVTIGLGSGRAPAGRSLERGGDGAWRPATALAGATPGCRPPTTADVEMGEVRLVPNPFARDTGDGAVHAYLEVPTAAVGYELRVFDLWGRVVRDLGGDDLGPGPREVVWDGRHENGSPLPAGGYVMVVRWRGTAGAVWMATRKLVVIRESGR